MNSDSHRLRCSQTRVQRRAHTHTRVHGPSEISTPPGRGCPFHQGTTASCSSSSRQPGNTARLTLPPQSSAHTQTAGQGRCHRRRPTKGPQRRLRASARGLTRKTRAGGATKSPTSSTKSSSSTTSRRWRGASYPVTFDSTGHPNRRGGGEPLTQLHSTLLGTPTDSAAGSLLPSFIQLYWAPQQTRMGGGTAKNSTPGGQACGSGRTETRSLHCDLLLDPLVAFSGLCLALV